ncbi:unnamed protein product [Spirodela intermedia]|uniref:Uncharacterized protein n=1 Tax=Spirodela intermedia TaxID=51605 RepID=A0ABN7ECL9_SPIIN|nr:unnamed protein product [Spirodela intermedia]
MLEDVGDLKCDGLSLFLGLASLLLSFNMVSTGRLISCCCCTVA